MGETIDTGVGKIISGAKSLSRGEGKGSGQRSENTEDMALGMGGESFSTAA